MEKIINYNVYRGKGRPRKTDYFTTETLYTMRQEQLKRVNKIVRTKKKEKTVWVSDLWREAGLWVKRQERQQNRNIIAKFLIWLNKNITAITASVWFLVAILWTVWTYTAH